MFLAVGRWGACRFQQGHRSRRKRRREFGPIGDLQNTRDEIGLRARDRGFPEGHRLRGQGRARERIAHSAGADTAVENGGEQHGNASEADAKGADAFPVHAGKLCDDVERTGQVIDDFTQERPPLQQQRLVTGQAELADARQVRDDDPEPALRQGRAVAFRRVFLGLAEACGCADAGHADERRRMLRETRRLEHQQFDRFPAAVRTIPVRREWMRAGHRADACYPLRRAGVRLVEAAEGLCQVAFDRSDMCCPFCERFVPPSRGTTCKAFDSLKPCRVARFQFGRVGVAFSFIGGVDVVVVGNCLHGLSLL